MSLGGDMDEAKRSNSVVKTLIGVPFALVAWALVYTAAHVALYLLDATRGLNDNWLQGIFRDLFTPAAGGYAAIFLVNKYLPEARLRWVTILFCAPLVVVFVGLSLYLIIFQSGKFEFSWGEQILDWGATIATCGGAYLACLHLVQDDELQHA